MAPYVIGAHPICRCTYKLIADTYVQSFVGGSAKIRLSATPVGCGHCESVSKNASQT